MKKMNVLAAVVAVLAAASVAGAQEIKVDFDGAKKGFQAQSMHDIFAAAHNIVPAGLAKGDADTEKRLIGGSGDPCCDDPTILCYAPCEPAEFRAAGPKDFKTLARYYVAQRKMKALVAEYYLSVGDRVSAESLKSEKVRVAAEAGVVYVLGQGRQEKIFDRGLAARLETMVRPEGQQKIHPGLIIIGGCMMDDACWEAVGDGVSAVSEWLNS